MPVLKKRNLDCLSILYARQDPRERNICAFCILQIVCICGYRLYFSQGQNIFGALGVSSMDVVGMAREAICRAPCLTFCPPPEPRFLQQHTRLPQHTDDLRAACFIPVHSAWSRCSHGSQTAGSGPEFKCAPGPWSRSTGPALEAMYCSSQIALALPQQPAPEGSVVGPTCKVMRLSMGFITKRGWWQQPGLALGWLVPGTGGHA